MRKTIWLALLLIAGCSAQPPRETIELRCSNAEDCAALWHGVTYWVTHNPDLVIHNFTPRRLDATVSRFGCVTDLDVRLEAQRLDTSARPSKQYSRPNGPARPATCSTAPNAVELGLRRDVRTYLSKAEDP